MFLKTSFFMFSFTVSAYSILSTDFSCFFLIPVLETIFSPYTCRLYLTKLEYRSLMRFSNFKLTNELTILILFRGKKDSGLLTSADDKE